MSCDDKIFVGSPCNKLYKQNIIANNSIRFSESVFQNQENSISWIDTLSSFWLIMSQKCFKC